jgi:hypothetical protein
MHFHLQPSLRLNNCTFTSPYAFIMCTKAILLLPGTADTAACILLLCCYEGSNKQACRILVGHIFESDHTEIPERSVGWHHELLQNSIMLKTWYGWKCYRIMARCLDINQQIMKIKKMTVLIYIIWTRVQKFLMQGHWGGGGRWALFRWDLTFVVFSNLHLASLLEPKILQWILHFFVTFVH